METKAVCKYCKTFLDWILAILHEWIALACGGVIMAAWFAISSFWGLSMKSQQFIWIAGLFFFLASFKAWKRERDKVLTLTHQIESILTEKNYKLSDEIIKRIEMIAERISIISSEHPANYHTEEDNGTYRLMTGIAAWVSATLTPEAASLYDSGIMEIHGSNLFPAGVGSTKHERDQSEIVARLHRRIANLKAIKTDIGKFAT
jgi:hypothetical protein